MKAMNRAHLSSAAVMIGLTLLASSFSIISCQSKPDLRLITILATNDIHGGIEPQPGPKENNRLGPLNITGGLAIFSGAVKAVKQGLQKKYGDQAGVLVLDAGDQFQGTLISNYTEGSLVLSAMNLVGYDAAVAGNHDYDFGPQGWLVDSVKDQDSSNPDHDSKGVIKNLIQKASFPFISANTYLKNSLTDLHGKEIDVSGVGCTPAVSGTEVNWAAAKRPDFLKPYLIKTVVGVRVAIIGIDNPSTPTTTTPDNVTDLCFRDEFETYKEVRAQLNSQADIFILVIHDGNTNNTFGVTQLATRLNNDSSKAVDVIIAGHTHYVHNISVAGIPVIQSGHGGYSFGRIDLVYDKSKNQLDRTKTIATAGARLDYAACDDKILNFCQVLSDSDGVSYEGVPVIADPQIIQQIKEVRSTIDPLASRILGHADADLNEDRIQESPLADLLTDAFRSISKSEVSILNTGGLRTSLKQGDVTYENLFQVLPFNNHGYVIGPMPATKIIDLLHRSIQTCGEYGALMQSGLKVSFFRKCAGKSVDENAQLVHVETLSGEVLLDLQRGIEPKDSRVFSVATLDFLAEGGSGYSDFIGTPKTNDLGVLREVLADSFTKNPGKWDGRVDNRWQELSQLPVLGVSHSQSP